VNIIHHYCTRDEIAESEGVDPKDIGEERIGAAVGPIM
jgi:hypothetical protein